jgi:hypothetical protein
MQFLFNSYGEHIANLVNGQLHSPRGQNIGHYINEDNIFIDMRGKYLGEIMNDDRLLYNQYSPYKNVNYGNYGNYGNVGNYGNPGRKGRIGLYSGYKDVNL